MSGKNNHHMDLTVRKYFDALYSENADLRYEAFENIMALTHEPVVWIYEIWDELLQLTQSKNNHTRTIAVQLLSNLAKSDSENRLLNDFDKLIAVTKDEKFVTARHSLQCLWKIAVVKPAFSKLVAGQLSERFKGAAQEKNGTLIRYDILEVFKKAFDLNQEENLRDLSIQLIDLEDDIKYRKKYTGLWKK
jgi:hypothetical protein